MVMPEGMTMEPVPLKRRQRSVYLRPVEDHGKKIWLRTEPLPSDPMGQWYYRQKGFRLASEGLPKEE